MEETPGQRPIAKGMRSCVGVEDVNFTKNLPLDGKVENYLLEIINSMINSLRELASGSFKDQAIMGRKQWIERDPAQITLLVNNIIWGG